MFEQTEKIHSCPQLMDYIKDVGFLPLLDSGIAGYSAEDIVDEECRYVVFPDGGWGWALLTTPEQLLGHDSFCCQRSPEESYRRLEEHFREILPDATAKQIAKLIG